ncbi:hypothetical protein ACWGLC_10260 [Dietzia sp. NPDC055877]
MLVVETLIAVTIALTTAFGGLVADDIISADGSCTISGIPDLWSHHCTSQARLAWFLGSAGLLIAMMALRHWMINRNGTLYYLRLLPAASADHLRGAMDMARARSLDFRTATGWFGAVGDVLDLRADVARVSDELERAMNDDDEATGYLFAPNLSFPAALSVGYDVLLRERTSLAEVPEEPRSTRIPGGDTGMRTVYFDDGYDEWSSRDWATHHETPDPDITLTTVVDPRVDRHEVRRVWLSLQVGPTGPVSEVDAQYPLRDTCDVVIVAGPVESVGGEVHLRPWEMPVGRWIPGSSGRKIDPKAFASLVVELSGAIEHVLDEYPEATVLLCGDLPRSVEFALGYVISERKDNQIIGKRPDLHLPQPGDSAAERIQAHAENAGLSSLNRFWASVTPMLVHLGEARPTLVHPAQRAEIVAALAEQP